MNSRSSIRSARSKDSCSQARLVQPTARIIMLIASLCSVLIGVWTSGCGGDDSSGSNLRGESCDELVHLLIGADLSGETDMARAFAAELRRRGSSAAAAINSGMVAMDKETRAAAAAANAQAALVGSADPQVVEIEQQYRRTAAHLRSLR